LGIAALCVLLSTFRAPPKKERKTPLDEHRLFEPLVDLNPASHATPRALTGGLHQAPTRGEIAPRWPFPRRCHSMRPLGPLARQEQNPLPAARNVLPMAAPKPDGGCLVVPEGRGLVLRLTKVSAARSQPSASSAGRGETHPGRGRRLLRFSFRVN